MNNPPDNPIVGLSDDTENVLPVEMDEPPRPFVKNFSGFMYYFVHFGFIIIVWSMSWVAINAITQRAGFASPFAMRVVWSLPLLGLLGTILSGYYPLGWVISIFVIGFGLLGVTLVVAALFGLYARKRLQA
jgi:hypothetical protein